MLNIQEKTNHNLVKSKPLHIYLSLLFDIFTGNPDAFLQSQKELK